MQSLRHRTDAECRWQGVLILTLICSLTFSLATRFWVLHVSQSYSTISADRRSVEPKLQHFDRDDFQWITPTATFRVIATTLVETCVAPTGPLLPQHVFSDCLYNRPPPSSGFLL